ncbi:uncharacterized protein B0H18DRAFT_1071027 [Fomitopsis serialis]|uniref:uncharacterized protein n=1 Tax=Fomitopsis serialis TaxID=139415 RepID=UPI0020080B70|nr:uncharacterized protein B0H18DRAFT_1071027 [Neoantrodia serialis]KAH9910314.1 hypothetical protein B0H18DRAFT_1071027 [Neoantrodia serialis]
MTCTLRDRRRARPALRFIRIGVRNKGCAGLSYQLEYVDKPGKFDEVVEQDGVKLAFKNPSIKDACGCGESFSVGS